MKTVTIDARGLLCPLPVLKARKTLVTTEGPLRLTVRVSDRATEKDFRLFCADAGYRLVAVQPEDDGAAFVIEKA